VLSFQSESKHIPQCFHGTRRLCECLAIHSPSNHTKRRVRNKLFLEPFLSHLFATRQRHCCGTRGLIHWRRDNPSRNLLEAPDGSHRQCTPLVTPQFALNGSRKPCRQQCRSPCPGFPLIAKAQDGRGDAKMLDHQIIHTGWIGSILVCEGHGKRFLEFLGWHVQRLWRGRVRPAGCDVKESACDVGDGWTE
jgi:hypothetical protein